MTMYQNTFGRSLRKENPSKPSKRIKGLLRIKSDVITIKQMLKTILCKEGTDHNHFEDYQGIVILYRKCFKDTSKVPRLTQEIHLINATQEQNELHTLLLELGNKHIAHRVKNEYDNVRLQYIIDNATQKAVDLDINQTLFEPLSCQNFKDLCSLMDLINKNIDQEINEIKKSILNEYNRELNSKQV